jgi:hypothetical protein
MGSYSVGGLGVMRDRLSTLQSEVAAAVDPFVVLSG